MPALASHARPHDCLGLDEQQDRAARPDAIREKPWKDGKWSILACPSAPRLIRLRKDMPL
eukprot:6169907-Amphidinium_carterae.2